MTLQTHRVPAHQLLEQSIGHLGDTLFLDYRHAIITARLQPGQLIRPDRMAEHNQITVTYATKILDALAVHHYLQTAGEAYRVTNWTDEDIADLIAATGEMQSALQLRFTERQTPDDIAKLYQTLAFRFSNPISPQQLEAFHIRFWSYFHQMLTSYKIETHRTINLATSPPYLRRRMLNALSHSELAELHANMKTLTKALETGNKDTIITLCHNQIRIFADNTIADNARYRAVSNNREANYTLTTDAISTPADRPIALRGYREPLGWEQYLAFQFA